MRRKLERLFDAVWDFIVPQDAPTTADVAARLEERQFLQEIDKARRDWNNAKAYFDNVTDPDLIDHAIYAIEAAERKYMYLLRRAQELGYSIGRSESVVADFPSRGLDAVSQS